MFVQVPSESIFVVVIFLCLGLKLTETNSDCPPFGALASCLSCCSSGSQIFFLADRIIIQHQLFIHPFQGKSYRTLRKMYSRPQPWGLQHSQHWYLLCWFSTLKVSLVWTTHVLVAGFCLKVDMAYIHASLIHMYLFAWLALAQLKNSP